MSAGPDERDARRGSKEAVARESAREADLAEALLAEIEDGAG